MNSIDFKISTFSTRTMPCEILQIHPIPNGAESSCMTPAENADSLEYSNLRPDETTEGILALAALAASSASLYLSASRRLALACSSSSESSSSRSSSSYLA